MLCLFLGVLCVGSLSSHKICRRVQNIRIFSVCCWYLHCMILGCLILYFSVPFVLCCTLPQYTSKLNGTIAKQISTVDIRIFQQHHTLACSLTVVIEFQSVCAYSEIVSNNELLYRDECSQIVYQNITSCPVANFVCCIITSTKAM